MAPLWAPVFPPTPAEHRGRKRGDLRIILGLILRKLRTGRSWQDLGPGGTSAFRAFQALRDAGVWEATWLAIVQHATPREMPRAAMVAAVAWQLEQKALRGASKKWLPAKAQELAGQFERRERRKKEAQKGPKKKRVWPKRPRQRRTIWRVPDALWARLEPILAEFCPRTNSRGAPRLDFRMVFNGILFQVRTGCQWEALPEHFGHYTTVHRWMLRWKRQGVLDAMVATLVREADAMGMVDWSQQAIDGSLGKARRGGESVGPNPTDRGKTGYKRSVVALGGSGLPIGCVTAAANVPDNQLITRTLEGRMKPLIASTRAVLIGDRGYRGKDQEAEIIAAGFAYRAPPRDRDDPYAILDKPLSKAERKTRARVEHCHAWMQNFRALLTRYSRKDDAFNAQIDVAIVLIWWRRMASWGFEEVETTAGAA